MNKIKYILCILAIFFSCGLFAQGSSPVLSIIEPLAKDSVSTGYLLDAAVDMVNLHRFNGSLTSDNYTDVGVFRNALFTLNSAKVNTRAASLDADSLTDALADTSVVNLGIALFKYNYIVSNAVTSGLLNYQGGKVYDVYSNGIWQNPYAEDYVFVFTPSRPCFSGSSVRFRFNSSHLYGNVAPSAIYFDAGDGDGYREINSSYDEIVGISDDLLLKMKVVLSDNTILEGHSILQYIDPPEATSCFSTPPTSARLFFLDGHPEVYAKVSYKAKQSGGPIKPFIFVEGFDDGIVGMLTVQNFGEFWNRLTFEGEGQFDFAWLYDDALAHNDDIKDNYDVFYVDWMNPYADIRDNAALLVDILDWINNQVKQNSEERNIIVGHSMGGLIVRYALRTMELASHAHETDVYVSFDSPQLGVNVPIGVLYALWDFYGVMYQESTFNDLLPYHLVNPVLSYLIRGYSSVSAKQMMYYYVPYGENATAAFHNTWQNELNSLGLPQGDAGKPIENLSIVNGGSDNSDNYHNLPVLDLRFNIANGNHPHLSWLQALSFLVAGTENLDLSIQADRSSGYGGLVCSSHASYRQWVPWLNDIKNVPLLSGGRSDTLHFAPSFAPGYDSMDSSYLSYGDTLVNIVSNQDTVRILTDPVAFVPSTSALAIPNSQNISFTNPPRPKIDTPFDSYFLHNIHVSHSRTDSTYCNWIITQHGAKISGPSGFIVSGDEFSTINIPPEYNNPVWTVSDTTVSVNNGVVYVKRPGSLITLTYKNHREYSYSDNKKSRAYIYKQRTVLAGFPPMTLTAERLNADQYRVTAQCVNQSGAFQSRLDELVAIDTIKYYWGVKNSDGSYNWCDSTHVKNYSVTVPLNSTVHVCMKLKSRDGLEGEPTVIDIRRSSATRLYTDPQEIFVNTLGFSMNYMFVSGIAGNKYLAVWCNPDYSGTPITPDTVQIGSNNYSVISTMNQTINGDSVTVYCFDIKNDPTIQQTIADIRNGTIPPGMHPGVGLTIKGSGVELMSYVLPIVSRIIPRPLDPNL